MRHRKCILDKGFLPEPWKVHLNQPLQHSKALSPAHLAGQDPSPGSHLCPSGYIHPGQGKGLVVVVGRMGQRESHPEKSMQGTGGAFLWHKQALESASPTQQDVSKYLTNERMNDR